MNVARTCGENLDFTQEHDSTTIQTKYFNLRAYVSQCNTSYFGNGGRGAFRKLDQPLQYKGVNPANEFHIRPDDVSMGDDVPELLRGLALGAAGELGF